MAKNSKANPGTIIRKGKNVNFSKTDICVKCRTQYVTDYIVVINQETYCVDCAGSTFPREIVDNAVKITRAKNHVLLKKMIAYSLIVLNLVAVFYIAPVLLQMHKSEKTLFILFTILNLPTFWYALRGVFRNRAEIDTAIKYAITPEIVSFFKGEYLKDVKYEKMLSTPFLIVALIVIIEYMVSTYVYYDWYSGL